MEQPKKTRGRLRLQKNYQVSCRCRGRSGTAETRDINLDGLKMATNMELEVGDLVELRIVPSDEVFAFTCDGQVVWVKPGEGALKLNVGIKFVEGLKDLAVDQLIGNGERLSFSQTIIINARQETCYRIITNFEQYPNWLKSISAAKVIEYSPDHKPLIVDFTFDAFLRKIRYILKYEYLDRDYTIAWKSIGGDLKTIEGNFVFQKVAEERTNVIYSVAGEVGFYVPKRILDYLSSITMKRALRSLKTVVEKGQQ